MAISSIVKSDLDPSNPVDLEHLRRYTFGSVELERELLDLFASQAPNYLSAMKSAGDAQSWKDAAHSLKGSARAVGANAVANEAERLE